MTSTWMHGRTRWFRTRDRFVTIVLAAALAALAGPGVAREARAAARPWLEAGPSFDPTHSRRMTKAAGFAVTGGCDVGRVVAVTLAAGYEHYPGHVSETVHFPSSIPPDERVESVTGRDAVDFSVGLKFAPELGRWEPFVEAGVGTTWAGRPRIRVTDVATDTVIREVGPTRQALTLGEFGLGVRTHREHRPDVQLAWRLRGFTQLMEGGGGSTHQVRLGVIF